MNVAVTERGGTYKRCRRQWMINSRNRWGLTRMVAPTPLALGTMVHDTLGLWLDMYKAGIDDAEHIPKGGLASMFVQYAQKTIDEAKATYERQVGTAMDEGELAPLMDTVTMGNAMMLNYQEHWKRPIPPDFDVVATEMHTIIGIPGTEHTSEWVWVPGEALGEGQMVQRHYDTPRLHCIEGRLDGVLREKRTGRLFVLEHKTYGQRPREDVLFSNDQFLAYHWMLLSIASDIGLDPAMVAGVAYDGLWKRAAPPKTVDGHVGTVADLFTRKLITRPRQELVEFGQMLTMETLEMANDPPIYYNRTSDGSCFYGCSDNQLCLSMSRGEDYEWLLRTKYKRKPESDDTLTRLSEGQWT